MATVYEVKISMNTGVQATCKIWKWFDKEWYNTTNII